MAKSKKSRIGREAIECLKAAWKNGVRFEGAIEVRKYLAATLRVKQSLLWSAGDWDCQARHELHREGWVVTDPVASNSYVRDPNPSPIDRMRSRRPGLLDLTTRAKHRYERARTDADQPDATRTEIEIAVHLEAIQHHRSKIRELAVQG